METASITIEELLQTTSRTFALSIPLLPDPLNHEITLAYLVFRIADTLEDADYLERDERLQSLDEFCELLEDLSESSVNDWTKCWASREISVNEDYNRLLRETPQVLGLIRELNASSQQIIVQHAIRSASGMSAVLSQADVKGNLQLGSIQDLRDYCYFVAGIVGELITALFVTGRWDKAQAKLLSEHAASFGEALQLVNILKDAEDDRVCGRAYLPARVSRSKVFDLANEDLRAAEKYVEALRTINAPPGFIAFCDAPLQLAQATLRLVAEQGPGSKVPREQTIALLQGVIQRAGISG